MAEGLRPLGHSDLGLIRQWRNSPEIKRYMFSQHAIEEGEHLEWFAASQANELRHLFVFEADGEARGFLQLQQTSAGSMVFEWGFYVSPEAKKGTGTQMTRLALQKAFEDLGAQKVFAEVLDFNLPSINLHRKLGFQQEGVLRKHHHLEEYHDVYCFGLLESEWRLQQPDQGSRK